MTPVLVDTSVWRRFFATGAGAASLDALLEEEGAVLLHPWVMGELTLGGVSAEVARLLGRLPQARVLPFEEVLAFVAGRRLIGAGVGWVDVNLLASALVEGARVYTRDRALEAAAFALGIAYRPAPG